MSDLLIRHNSLILQNEPPGTVAILSGVIDTDTRGGRVVRHRSRIRDPESVWRGRFRERDAVPCTGDAHDAAQPAGTVCQLFDRRRCRLFRTGIRPPVGMEQGKIVARQNRTDEYRLWILPHGGGHVQTGVQTVDEVHIRIAAGEVHRFGARCPPSAIRMGSAIRHSAVRLGLRDDPGKRTGRRLCPQSFAKERACQRDRVRLIEGARKYRFSQRRSEWCGRRNAGSPSSGPQRRAIPCSDAFPYGQLRQPRPRRPHTG